MPNGNLDLANYEKQGFHMRGASHVLFAALSLFRLQALAVEGS